MPRSLSIALIAGLCLTCTAKAQEPPKEPDAVSKRLIQATEDFRKACEMADRELFLAIEAEVQVAQSDGNFDRAKKLMKIKEACQTVGLLPTDESVIRARSEYDRQFQEAKATCLEEFAKVVAEHTKNGEMARAEKAKAEERKWLDFVKSRKTPKTRFGITSERTSATPWRGHGYKVFKETLSWHDAKKRCEEVGGHLVIINDAEEQAFVVELLGRNGMPVDSLQNRDWTGVWIGATDEAKEGEWKCVDGSPLAYANWAQEGHGLKQPNGGPGSHYPALGIHYGGTWDDRASPDRHSKAFICEWDE